MDALAADGVLFERAYSSSPWTLPAHVSLLTSLVGMNHGIYCPDDRMDSSLTTLAELLGQNGFFTSAVTGGGYVSARFGFSRGFEGHTRRHPARSAAALTAFPRRRLAASLRRSAT